MMLAQLSLDLVGGLAADGKGFMATTGTGDIVSPDGAETRTDDFAWDNHMLRFG